MTTCISLQQILSCHYGQDTLLPYACSFEGSMLKSLTRDTVPAKQGRSEIRGCTTASSEHSCPPTCLPFELATVYKHFPETLVGDQFTTSLISSRQRKHPHRTYDESEGMYPKYTVRSNGIVGCFSVMIEIVSFSPCRVRDLLLRTSHIHPYTVKSKLKGGNLGSWMATRDASLTGPEITFSIEI